ncbi:MAG: UDP-N-acetylmuramoyl-tripeptide--D-alanyl-D-alanine ligase [Pseudomonadota bacterium]
MKLSQLAASINGQLIGSDGEFSSVSTDTRTLQQGDLFVALQGPNFDGHTYLPQAFAKGAVAALVSKPCDVPQPQILVADTLRGLGDTGRVWAQQFAVKKIAITGSSGKTTLKEMVAAILAEVAETLSTKGNLNNDIGVPLTLSRLNAQHRFAVVECGANHVGEIAYTVNLVQPDVAVVNNVAPAHLEGFGSIDRVAQAKGEIYSGLGVHGVAVINLDDAYAHQFLAQTSKLRQLTFSLRNPQASVVADNLRCNALGQYAFTVQLPDDQFDIQLPLLGVHNVRNALAACALTLALDIPVAAMLAGLKKVRAVPGRLFPVEDLPGFNIIDDSYNANPASLKAAIDVLADVSSSTCLVLGGMGELGDTSAQLHEQVGSYAAQKGILRVYSLGPNAGFYQRGYVQHQPPQGRFIVCDSHQQIADNLKQHEKDKTILVKGSRSTAMEKVIHALRGCDHLREETH